MKYTDAKFIILFFCLACASHEMRWEGDLLKDEDRAKRLFNECETYFNNEDFENSEVKADEYLKNFGDNTPLSDNIYLLKGLIESKRGNHEESKRSFEKVLREYKKSDVIERARLYLADSLKNQEKHNDALLYLRKISYDDFTPSEKIFLFRLLFTCYINTGDIKRAIFWIVKERELSDAADGIKIDKIINEYIENKFSATDLLAILPIFKKKYPGDFILYKLIRLFDQRGEHKEALSMIEDYKSSFPKGTKIDNVLAIESNINKIKRINAWKIGVLLPLSGEYEKFGSSILNGIILASNLLSTSPEKNLELAIRDSRGNPEIAEKAIEDLIVNERVIAIIGPISNKVTVGAAQKADSYETPIITLTQKEGITSFGKYIFRIGFTKSHQVNALINFSHNTLGIKNFAILAPKHPYGDEFTELFVTQVKKDGLNIKKIQTYETSQKDFSLEIKKMVAGGIDFEGLFIPDQYLNVSLILPALSYYDLVGVQLLGTSGWNEKELIQRAGKDNIQGAIFPDGFDRESSEPIVSEFIHNFSLCFGKAPELLEALGFDAMAISIAILKNFGAKDRESFKNALTKLKDFNGVTGKISFNDERDINKEVYLFSFDEGKLVRY